MPPTDRDYPPLSSRARGRIFSVPHGTPFFGAVAQALLAGNLPVAGGPRPAPLALSAATLLLPTRRDIRALQEAVLAAANGAALLLPRIKLISHTGEAVAVDGEGRSGDGKPAIGKLERDLALTRLVLTWSAAIARSHGGSTRTPAQAMRQAKDLGRLMDLVEMEEVDLGRLAELVPDDYSAHWGLTLEFLKIVREHWPRHLAEAGKVSPAAWRQGLMLAEAERLRTNPPAAPVIVAGVTGTVPAATALMRAVLELDEGALVLPALDQRLDADSWAAIGPAHPEHPQFGLKKLLAALGVDRHEVAVLPGCTASAGQAARYRLISEAMRPAGTTEHWHRFLASASQGAKQKPDRAADPSAELAGALRGWALIEAASPADEAEAVALLLREAAEQPGKTAMLVTPDRALARRVSARLKAWDLEVPDQAGRGLASTESGVFLDLVIDAAGQSFAPIALLTLLKHRLCRGGLAAATLAEGLRVLELAVFRAPYLGSGLAEITNALERAANGRLPGAPRIGAVRRIDAAGWHAARLLAARLEEILQPLAILFADPSRQPVQALAAAHLKAAEALAGGDGAEAGGELWQGEGGEELAGLFASLLDPELVAAPQLAAADYPEFYRAILSDQSISPQAAMHPDLAIVGPLEARLQQPDIVILGSLNEGVWPQPADPGPWFNRSMRQALGLPAAEARIGEAAHDFCSLLGAPQVYLTRANKSDGVPTVPSRWLIRLQVLVDAALAGAGASWLAWADQRNRMPASARPVAQPAPRPAVALRPRQLSVTDIEKWIANPYAIFAARILALERLPELMRAPDAALRGQIVHAALSRFARKFPQALPQDCAAELMAAAHDALLDFTGSPRVAAFWAPRLERFAAWFAETEPARRRAVRRAYAELDGRLVLPALGGAFTLRARADRIDAASNGLIITDYKTSAGLDTLIRHAKAGRAPQLPLEAAIAAAGGFPHLPAQAVVGLRYISAAGGEPPGLEADLVLTSVEIADLAEVARAGLLRLVADFDRVETPYRALRRPRFRYDFDDFAHLARVAEWSIESDEEAA